MPGGPPAEAPCPLHALPAQQRVVGLVTGSGVPVVSAAAELLFGVFGVLPVLHADGDLRLERKVTRKMKGCIKKEADEDVLSACQQLDMGFGCIGDEGIAKLCI